MQQHLSCTGWLWPNRFYQSSSRADLETAEAAHRLVSERSEGWIIVVQVEMVTDALLPLVKMSPFGKGCLPVQGALGGKAILAPRHPPGMTAPKQSQEASQSSPIASSKEMMGEVEVVGQVSG